MDRQNNASWSILFMLTPHVEKKLALDQKSKSGNTRGKVSGLVRQAQKTCPKFVWIQRIMERLPRRDRGRPWFHSTACSSGRLAKTTASWSLDPTRVATSQEELKGRGAWWQPVPPATNGTSRQAMRSAASVQRIDRQQRLQNLLLQQPAIPAAGRNTENKNECHIAAISRNYYCVVILLCNHDATLIVISKW